MPFTVDGIGTTLYGAREFLPNGSYVATEWGVFFYIPIVPIRSMRILPSTTGRKSYFLYSSPRYSVLQTTSLNLRQVLSVYGWFALVIGSFWVADALNLWWLAIPGLCMIGAPWFLRRRAIKRMLYEHKRSAAGLSPSTMG